MALLSKEAYEGKQRYADRRMAENAEIETLTEEQHEVLSWLCSIRHEMHCNQEDFFLAESANNKEFWEFVGVDENGEIVKKLESAGLPAFIWSFSTCVFDLPSSDSECYELGYSEEEIEEERESCLELASRINRDIEKYLFEIDKEHGTRYCPTGIARMRG